MFDPRSRYNSEGDLSLLRTSVSPMTRSLFDLVCSSEPGLGIILDACM